MDMRKDKRVALCFITAIMIAVLLPCQCRAAEAEHKAVENACKGVVRIFAVYGEYFGCGSGFGVGTAGQMTDIYVTNRHVVTDDDGKLAEKVYILLSNDAVLSENGYITKIDESKMVECEVVYVTDAYPDVAILKAVHPIEDHIALPLMYAEDANRGDKIYTLGFPASADIANTGYFYAEIDDVDMNSGVISKFFEFEREGYTMAIQHHVHINHGNSGGPLVTKDGAVIGINTYGYGDVQSDGGSQIEYFVSIYVDYAMVGLDKLGIDYDIYDPYTETWEGNGTKEERKTQFLLIISAIIMGSLFLLAAVVILLKKKKKESHRLAKKDIGTLSAGNRLQDSVMPKQPTLPASSAAKPSDSGIRLQGVSGAFSGRRFPVDRKIRIGRDPSRNDLVYPAGSRGVSAVHCEVHFCNDQIFLFDVGSSYGTFLHGKKISANRMIPICIGDTFYLGNPQESFIITAKSGK